MTEYTEAEQRYLDFIQKIEGITLLAVEKPGRMVSAGIHGPCISWIDDRKHTVDEVDDWVVRTLKRERIQGQFFLEIGPTSYARVQLESPWFWGRTLWRERHHLALASLEKDYAISLFWSEHCLRRGRERLGYGAFRWIKPPANAPIFWDRT